MPGWLVLLVVLSTYRLTRLIVADHVLDAPRTRLAARSSRLADFLSCPWCVSVWVAIPVAWLGLVHQGQQTAQVIGLVLSASAVSGYLATFDPES